MLTVFCASPDEIGKQYKVLRRGPPSCTSEHMTCRVMTEIGAKDPPDTSVSTRYTRKAGKVGPRPFTPLVRIYISGRCWKLFRNCKRPRHKRVDVNGWKISSRPQARKLTSATPRQETSTPLHPNHSTPQKSHGPSPRMANESWIRCGASIHMQMRTNWLLEPKDHTGKDRVDGE